MLALLSFGCKPARRVDLITRVYVPEGTPGVILFDTESEQRQVLIEDKDAVFVVMQTSLSQEWVVVSKMSALAEEARGSSEEKLLLHVPQRRLIYHPEYGREAYLVSVDAQGNTESALWLVDTASVAIPLTDLRNTCFGDARACSGTPSISKRIKTGGPGNSTVSQPEEPVVIGGWLTVGVSQEAVEKQLGRPEEKGEDQHWRAIGTYVQAWRYPTRGVQLEMESENRNGAKKVRAIIVTSPSELTTRESIGIGSSYDKVTSTYASHIDTGASDENTIVIGSLYGGMIVGFTEGKASRILIGAAAE